MHGDQLVAHPRFIDRGRDGVWLYDAGDGVIAVVPRWRTFTLDDLEMLHQQLRTLGRQLCAVRVATRDELRVVLRLVAAGVYMTPAARRALRPYLPRPARVRVWPWVRAQWKERRQWRGTR